MKKYKTYEIILDDGGYFFNSIKVDENYIDTRSEEFDLEEVNLINIIKQTKL